MGVGDPLEAATTLAGPIRAGSWHLVGDGLILGAVDMRFDVVWRHAGADSVVVSFSHHFDLPAGPDFRALPFEADAAGEAVAARDGDQLVLRMTASQSTAAGPAYVPNADGPNTGGRIPSIQLP